MKKTDLVLCLAAVCGGGLFAQETHQGDERPPATEEGVRIALVYEKTRFKTALVATMEEILGKKQATVTKARHSKKGVSLEDPSGYDAVFLTNSGVFSKVRPWITEWLEKNRAHKEKILLHTTQKSDWDVTAEVDAVTSASSMSDLDSLAAEYAGRLITRTAATGDESAPGK